MIRCSVRDTDPQAAALADQIDQLIIKANMAGYRILTGAGFEISYVEIVSAEGDDEDGQDHDECQQLGGCPFQTEDGCTHECQV